MKVDVEIWDWPLRLFHWLLVVGFIGAYATGELGGNLTDWHARLGSLVLGLITFRLIWGLIGTRHSRFSSFFPSINKLRRYFKGDWQEPGHNPAGALAVFALLCALTILVTTGLFANDDIAFNGPLFDLIDKDLSDKLSGWHAKLVNILIGLIVVHVAAIVFYQRVKKTNLILPMITGKKALPAEQQSAGISGIRVSRLVTTILIASTVVWTIWNTPISNYISLQASNHPTDHTKT